MNKFFRILSIPGRPIFSRRLVAPVPLRAFSTKKKEQKNKDEFTRLALFAGLFQMFVMLSFPPKGNEKDQKNEKNKKISENESEQPPAKKEEINFTIFFGKKKEPESVEAPVVKNKNFEDCVGIDPVVEEMKQIVDFIKHPKKYEDLGGKFPRGILLTGPPGTGKTLVARSLADAAECTFFYRSGADFDHKYVGEGARKVRELFEEARKKAPAIIFIDEIDSIGGKRRTSQGVFNLTINQFLTEMDGFNDSSNIIVIGATNRAEHLDQALMRPGRFDKTIYMEAPTEKNRMKILDHYLSKVKADQKIDTEILSRETIGMTGADLNNLVNIAAIRAVREGNTVLGQDHLEKSLLRVRHGLYGVPNKQQNMKKIATYQAAKAVMLLKEPSRAIEFIHATILPVNGSPGDCAVVPQIERPSVTKGDLLKEIDFYLIGRVMEEMEFGSTEVSQRSNDDLQKATKIAKKIVKNFDDKFIGLIEKKNSKEFSSENLYKLESEIINLLKTREIRVRKFVAENKNLVERVAQMLLQKETMRKSEILSLIS